MTTETSAATGRYPLTMMCAVFRVLRTTVYAQTAVSAAAGGKRGPHTSGTDDNLVAAIRVVLAESPFHGEGHRKVRVRLRAHGWRVGKNRVLRLMRLHRLLAPQRTGHPHGDPAHAGTITTERPNLMWDADATPFYTERDGWCWFVGALDHASDDIVGWHVAQIGDRWAALEPSRAVAGVHTLDEAQPTFALCFPTGRSSVNGRKHRRRARAAALISTTSTDAISCRIVAQRPCHLRVGQLGSLQRRHLSGP